MGRRAFEQVETRFRFSKLNTSALCTKLTKIANSCGVPTTCVESRLPYRDEGIDKPTQKRADVMTLQDVESPRMHSETFQQTLVWLWM